MQAKAKNIMTNVYKVNKANFSGNWTSNSMTGEATVRHLAMNIGYVNGYAVFNRNNVKTRGKVSYNLSAKANQNKDFPDISSKIAFLTGQKGKI